MAVPLARARLGAPTPRAAGYQTRYFLLESFEAGAAQLREYCNSLQQRLPADVLAAVA